MYNVSRFLLAAAVFMTSSTIVLGYPISDIFEAVQVYKRCTGTQYDLTVENYNNANTDQWLANWWANATPEQKQNGLTASLAAEFMPNVRDFRCGINSQCVVGDCDNVNFSLAGAEQAYYVLESIVTLTQAYTFMWNAFNVAGGLVNQQAWNIVPTFYTNGVSLPSNQDKGMDQFIEVLVAAISIYVSYASFPLLSIPGIASAFNPGKAGQYSSIALIESLQSWLQTDTAATPADLELASLATFYEFIGRMTEQGEVGSSNILTGLLSGGDDGNGKHLSDYIAGGQFLGSTGQGQEPDVEYLKTLMIAGAINVLYTQGYTYIVGVPVLSGQTCESDTRGPSDTKWCRDDGSVYYAYTIPSHGEPNAQVWPPTGYDKLPNYNITIQQAIESSVKAYSAGGFNYANVQQSRWNDAMANWGVGNRPVDQGVAFEGVFTIPVCIDPTGQSVSTIYSNSGRNYPCTCGQNGVETGAFMIATGYLGYPEYQKWCHQPDWE